jgi:outer membrane protein OmpA-like peptidoglycan-associated protein
MTLKLNGVTLMEKIIKTLKLALASSSLVTIAACGNTQEVASNNSPFVMIPVPKSQISQATQVTRTKLSPLIPVPVTTLENYTLIPTEKPQQPAVNIPAKVEPKPPTNPPPVTRETRQTPPVQVSPAPTPQPEPKKTAEPPTLTPEQVEETLTELKAEKTIEGITINLPEQILFEFDQYAVRSAAKPTLIKIAQLLNHYQTAQIFIYGHTDNKGTKDYNQQLSEKRAAAVKYYFVNNFQVEPTRLQTKGYGDTQPIASNTKADGSDNPEGRQQNRRVEVMIKTASRTVEISPNADIFTEASNTAMSAAVLTQTAKTQAEWQKVAHQWQEAIALMEVVPQSSSNYKTAQTKIAEYQKNLEYAVKNADKK